MRGSIALVPCASRDLHEHCENCVPESAYRLPSLMLQVRDAPPSPSAEAQALTV